MSKGLKILAYPGARIVAAMLLGWTLLALSGCFVLEDDPVLPDVPRKRNSPPRIVGQTPQDNFTNVQIGPSCSPEFSVRVEDDDRGDTLAHKWWVDANPGYVSDIKNSEILGIPVIGGKDLVRVVKAPKAVINHLADGKSHRVEVFVTDGHFETDSLIPGANPIEPPVLVPRDAGCLPEDAGCYFNGAVLPSGEIFDAGFDLLADEAYRVSYMWLVTTEACPQ